MYWENKLPLPRDNAKGFATAERVICPEGRGCGEALSLTSTEVSRKGHSDIIEGRNNLAGGLLFLFLSFFFFVGGEREGGYGSCFGGVQD